ncbi:MAG: acyl-CoA dehydrogenase family protein [Bacteroidota bacterium]|nr:acyl-CoA dehydrogenase family protein [Bacteroidota bacterium]
MQTTITLEHYPPVPMHFNFNERELELRKAAFEAGIICYTLSFEECWKIAATQGLVGCVVPAEYGGPGLNAIETAASLEGFSEGCKDGGFTFSLAAHLMAGVIPVVKNASSEIKKRILPQVVNDNYILANAMTEAGSGSNAFGMKTTAKADGDQFILNGSKIFCTNASIANGILVYALTDETKGFFGGITCFLLEKDKHAYKCGKPVLKNGLHSSPLSEVFLDNIPVSKENIIGKIGSGVMIFLESMNWERVVMSAMHAGTMDRLCTISRDYVKTRLQGEKALEKHQAVQFRIAEMYLQTEISKLLAYRAAKMIDAGTDVTAAAAKAKIFSSEALNAVAKEALILHGANGFTDDYGIGKIIADAQAALIYSGPNDVLRNLVASRL